MKVMHYKSLALALVLLVPVFTIGCGGSNPQENANEAAKAQAAMDKGAAPVSDKGQSFQAPPAPPP